MFVCMFVCMLVCACVRTHVILYITQGYVPSCSFVFKGYKVNM